MAADTDLKEKCKVRKFVTGPPPVDPTKCYVNQGEEDQMEIQGYTISRLKCVIVYFFIIITIGLLRLVFHWVPQWLVWVTHRKCSLAEATTVLLRDQYKQWFVAKVDTMTKDGTRVEVLKPSVSFSIPSKSRRRRAQLFLNTGQRDENLIRYFVVKRVKFIWNAEEDKYQKLRGLEVNNTCSYFHEAKGLSYEHQRKR
ncbi:polyamine-transporting ATPase 13A3-like isoform X2 [Ruditapes philippinarum]|uniref:polyamine-transporting ATPase 13A3-like isoform X2 n=1 Tax=Ruditapes philippinarum TaxID=129788 RepID=UPI00295C0723|nr:polyamine-transporting ATPase 13A3-like isoform X2 [Ruditapes philippinarum]